MKAVEWIPALELGVPIIDDQHQSLVRLLNELQRLAQLGVSRQTLSEIFEELELYTLNHFRDEEILMRQIGYEFYESHCLQHRELALQLEEYREGFVRGEVDIFMVVDFLMRWILTHIAGADTHIANAVSRLPTAKLAA